MGTGFSQTFFLWLGKTNNITQLQKFFIIEAVFLGDTSLKKD